MKFPTPQPISRRVLYEEDCSFSAFSSSNYDYKILFYLKSTRCFPLKQLMFHFSKCPVAVFEKICFVTSIK